MHTQMYMIQTRKVWQFLMIVEERKIAYLILTGNGILLTGPQTCKKQKNTAEMCRVRKWRKVVSGLQRTSQDLF